MRSLITLLCVFATEAASAPCQLFHLRRADLLIQQEYQHGRSSAFPPKPSNTKHQPYLENSGDGYASISVGLGSVTGDTKDPTHPNVVGRDPKQVHYISNIHATDESGNVIAMAEFSGTEGSPPVLRFAVPKGVQKITPHAFCNRHGLFSGTEMEVETSDEELSCELQSCAADTMGVRGGVCVIFSSVEAEALRRQVAEQQELLPFEPNKKNLKHTPIVSIEGTKAVVTVGGKDNTHPVVGRSPGLHYIHSIYVKNQAGKVVAAATLSPSNPSPSFSFDIPAGTGSLTAHAYCNLHGLFKGPPTPVEHRQISTTLEPHCGLTLCLGQLPGERKNMIEEEL